MTLPRHRLFPAAGSGGATTLVTIVGPDSCNDADALALTLAQAVAPVKKDEIPMPDA